MSKSAAVCLECFYPLCEIKRRIGHENRDQKRESDEPVIVDFMYRLQCEPLPHDSEGTMTQLL
jgi:hypothetical protein